MAEVLARWLGGRGGAGQLQLYRIQDRWAALVGSRVAARTRATTLRDGVLTVVVAGAAWLNELTYLRGQMVQQINEGLAGEAGPAGEPIRAIRLVSGKIRRVTGTRTDRAPLPPVVELPLGAAAQVDEELRDVSDPELRQAMKQARLAQMRRTLRFGGE